MTLTPRRRPVNTKLFASVVLAACCISVPSAHAARHHSDPVSGCSTSDYGNPACGSGTQYQDPNAAAPDPDAMFALMVQLCASLSPDELASLGFAC